jgi:glutamyl-Q tRNA(Asp) synthetase
VRDAHGDQLSKQTGAHPLDVTQPLAALRAAASVLGLGDPAPAAATAAEWLAAAVAAWTERWVRAAV